MEDVAFNCYETERIRKIGDCTFVFKVGSAAALVDSYPES